MTTVTRSIRFAVKGRRKHASIATDPSRQAAASAAHDAGRVPRVARLMALAIRFDELLRTGVVENQTELARLARVTQPRMTQIMNLLHLAPDIQEALLFLPPTVSGRDPLNERRLRRVASEVRWSAQRRAWRRVDR